MFMILPIAVAIAAAGIIVMELQGTSRPWVIATNTGIIVVNLMLLIVQWRFL
jgi:hypothetical protein